MRIWHWILIALLSASGLGLTLWLSNNTEFVNPTELQDNTNILVTQAAWVQAIFSVIAIVAAILIGDIQHNRLKDSDARKSKSIAKKRATFQSRRMYDLARDANVARANWRSMKNQLNPSSPALTSAGRDELVKMMKRSLLDIPTDLANFSEIVDLGEESAAAVSLAARSAQRCEMLAQWTILNLEANVPAETLRDYCEHLQMATMTTRMEAFIASQKLHCEHNTESYFSMLRDTLKTDAQFRRKQNIPKQSSQLAQSGTSPSAR
ncbi:TPA: hypothetical protein ACKQCD_003083 [Stenotrophomonas maltophilia]